MAERFFLPGRRSRVVALRTFTAHRGRLDWLAAEDVFCFWRRLSLRTVVNYALIYRVARPAPIRFTEPVRIIAPRTASTVVGLTSGRILQISALDSGVRLFRTVASTRAFFVILLPCTTANRLTACSQSAARRPRQAWTGHACLQSISYFLPGVDAANF